MGHVGGGVLQLLTCMLMWVMWGGGGGVTVTDLYVDVGHEGGVLQLLTCMLMWVMWGGGVTVTDLYVDVGHVGGGCYSY